MSWRRKPKIRSRRPDLRRPLVHLAEAAIQSGEEGDDATKILRTTRGDEDAQRSAGQGQYHMQFSRDNVDIHNICENAHVR